MRKTSWTESNWVWAIGGIVATAIVVAISTIAAQRVAGNGEDAAGWVQAIGATISISLAIWIALWQHSRAVHARQDAEAAAEKAAHNAEKSAAGAAFSMAYEVLEIVGDRLNVALDVSKAEYGLRGFRTTEMVDAMRAIDTARIPTAILTDFVKIRSRAYAINARISDLYRRENTASTTAAMRAHESKRSKKLASAVRTHGWALNAFERLQNTAAEKWQIEAASFTALPHVENYVYAPGLTDTQDD